MTNESSISDSLELRARGGFPLHPFMPRRYRPGGLGTWSGHLAFANDLILAQRPNLIVELGTHFGESYFGFCQTVLDNALPTVCYAIDHWMGEPHAGFYGEDVYEEVARYNEAVYKAFSYLIRSSFDAAADAFSEGSIDLIHIDGLHTYDAVRHDFETWVPKVRPGGLILLHDVAVRHNDFRVWQFWEEIERNYRETLCFHHWWGLGVVRKPTSQPDPNPFLEFCFGASPEAKECMRRQYAIYAGFLEHTFGTAETSMSSVAAEPENQAEDQPLEQPDQSRANQVKFQLFAPCDGLYTEDKSITKLVPCNEHHELSFELSAPVDAGPLRIDPADQVCIVEIGKIVVRTASSNVLIWEATEPETLRHVKVVRDLLILPGTQKYVLFSFGRDPVFLLPEFTQAFGAVCVDITIRIETSLSAVAEAFQILSDEHQKQISARDRQFFELRTELASSQSERMILSAQLTRMTGERNQARDQIGQGEQHLSKLRMKHASLTESAAENSERLQSEAKTLQAQLAREKAISTAIQQSRSWKVTKPLRWFVRRVGAHN